MSPWWREQVEVVLAPDAVRVARFAAGLRPRCIERVAHAVDGRDSAALIAALGRCAWTDAARVHVRVSSHLVRLHLLPWTEAVATDAECEALARVELEAVHGPAARGWALGFVEPRAREALGVAAVDRALLDGVRALCAQRRGVLASFAPAAAVALARASRRRSATSADARTAVAWCEPGRVTLAVHAGGRLEGLANPRAPRGALAALNTALATRADDRTGRGSLAVVFAGAREALPARIGDWDVERVTEHAWDGVGTPSASRPATRAAASEVAR